MDLTIPAVHRLQYTTRIFQMGRVCSVELSCGDFPLDTFVRFSYEEATELADQLLLELNSGRSKVQTIYYQVGTAFHSLGVLIGSNRFDLGGDQLSLIEAEVKKLAYGIAVATWAKNTHFARIDRRAFY